MSGENCIFFGSDPTIYVLSNLRGALPSYRTLYVGANISPLGKYIVMYNVYTNNNHVNILKYYNRLKSAKSLDKVINIMSL